MHITQIEPGNTYLIVPYSIRDLSPNQLPDQIEEVSAVAWTTAWVFVRRSNGQRGSSAVMGNARQFSRFTLQERDKGATASRLVILPQGDRLTELWKNCLLARTKNTTLGLDRLIMFKSRLIALLDAPAQGDDEQEEIEVRV